MVELKEVELKEYTFAYQRKKDVFAEFCGMIPEPVQRLMLQVYLNG
jgi:hypothetical protein